MKKNNLVLIGIIFKSQEKCPNMVIVWVAIYRLVVCLSLYVIVLDHPPSVDSLIYIDKCLEKSLLPLIEKHHVNSNYIFWPDLVSSHYSGLTVKKGLARNSSIEVRVTTFHVVFLKAHLKLSIPPTF